MQQPVQKQIVYRMEWHEATHETSRMPALGKCNGPGFDLNQSCRRILMASILRIRRIGTRTSREAL